MRSRQKTKDISWLSFILFIILLYALLMMVYYAFAYISAPALAYDAKQKQILTSELK